MRIGTWNLEGKWSVDHASIIESMNADLLLLTEVPVSISLDRYSGVSSGLMSVRNHWSAAYSRVGGWAAPSPHETSAAWSLGDLAVVSTVLPWPTWQPGDCLTDPWTGPQAHRMVQTCDAIVAGLADCGPLIWGGDWNTPLEGTLAGFDRSAQEAVLRTVERLDLHVATAHLAHANRVSRSIDHIALPSGWAILEAEVAEVPRSASDHSAYVVEVQCG